MRTLTRGGPYLRIADPDWENPLDGRFAAATGGRWNPPGSFPVVYLCATLEVARANVYRKLARQPYGPEDLDPSTAPLLVGATVPEDRYADAVTARGLKAVGLPQTYPNDSRGRVLGWARCQAIGLDAWQARRPGLAARSAAWPGGEELAFFQRRRRLRRGAILAFEDWFW